MNHETQHTASFASSTRKPFKSAAAVALGAWLFGGVAQAATEVEMHRVSSDGVGETVGSIMAEDTADGLLLTPKIEGLESGIHGFHLHANASCEPAEKDGEAVAGAAAGGHFDPEETGTHQGPYGDGHLGDLPALSVDADGKISLPVLAPRLKESDLGGHALMIHSGGDNYTDTPKLGGGGSRVACGVVK
ncbi:superoxide dismutase [Cu-Zn] SodC [Cobetia marina]|uniref:superoxide dismutase family protein n=1 Tax=Cobetia TaxID=204286 RepID=UPI000A028CD3|nr:MULTISPECIES: superoxide dismutase family protein [Cobetia]AZV30171.1 superoxide dismutase [Cobetia sp. ICG0124]MDH2291603.1 superoxide dismutase [Cu-Zn] SodC [Cobetia sp. 10Alg 146]MDH2374135.1 superoxide dismutase [Cu-Zn] SodC [Cobetia sp. 3AK]MDI6004673.1 superoxide dismutase [Cu-Zn] SodC [Cobetia pacifica]MDO6787294.1 superoxide dismutase [Cu-Zn] SodC [Cobetia marina]